MRVNVEIGARVASGTELMTIESMKMEIPVEAPSSGVVAAVRAAIGDVVQEGDVLLELQPE